MRKQLLFISLVAAAMLTSCSSDDDGYDSRYDNLPVELRPSDIPISLSSGSMGTRASVDSDENGLFETTKDIGVFALARKAISTGVSNYAWNQDQLVTVYLNNVAAKAGKNTSVTPNRTDIKFKDAEQANYEMIRYYPLISKYCYSFYAYHPRVESGINISADQVNVPIEFNGMDDLLYGMAESRKDGVLTPYGFSAKYFRESKENYELIPELQFNHLLMQLQFTYQPGADYKTVDPDNPTYNDACDMKLMKIEVTNVPQTANLILANRTDYKKNGTLDITDWTNEDSQQTLVVKKSDEEDLDTEGYQVKTEEKGGKTVPVVEEIGQGLMLPVPPALSANSTFKYNVRVTVKHQPTGGLYTFNNPLEINGTNFQAGKLYTVNLIIHGLKELQLQAKLTNWIKDDESVKDIQPDDNSYEKVD